MMKMNNKIRLLATFYRSVCLAALFFSAIGIFILIEKGFSAFNVVFWFKIITTGLIVYNKTTNRGNEFFYYQNLGLSKTMLWTFTLGFDFLLFILAVLMI
jgi:hypothetical protein